MLRSTLLSRRFSAPYSTMGGIDTFVRSGSLEPTADTRVEIGAARARARTLVVIVSSHAVRSADVAADIASFRAEATARVVPVRLDATALEAVIDSADRRFDIHDGIDMTTCMLTGFQTLFRLFEKTFLARPQHRNATEDRRVAGDRRTRMSQRLRGSFWERFHEKTGLERYEELTLDPRQRRQIVEALEDRANDYRFYDDNNTPVEPTTALATAMETFHVAAGMRLSAVNVVEGFAAHLTQRYDTRLRARRATPDRRTTQAEISATPANDQTPSNCGKI